MDLQKVLPIIEIIISIVLIVSILLQEKEGGLGNTFGGGSGPGIGYKSKRGFDLLLSRITIISIILFVINSLAIIFINL